MSEPRAVIRTLPHFARTPEPRIYVPIIERRPVMGVHDDNPRALLEEYDACMLIPMFRTWMDGYSVKGKRNVEIDGVSHENSRKALGYKHHARYARLHKLDRMTFLRAIDEEDARHQCELAMACEKCLADHNEATRQYARR